MTSLRATMLPAAVLLLGGAPRATVTPPPMATLPAIALNDNRVPAGRMVNNVLEVDLEARPGSWYPYGKDSIAIPMIAFAEVGKSLQTPGPLVRVTAGTRIHARVKNSAATTLVVHGLADRRHAIMDSLVIPAGETREASFVADEAGTFFYWGSTTGAPLGGRFFEDSHLSGALIVDPPGVKTRPDRVFVIQFWVAKKLPNGEPEVINFLFTINGRPWPFTERLSANQGDSLHWRIINASADIHPLHLHGFYFRITARGDLRRDTLYRREQERMAVTEPMNEGTTEDISWFADRPGAWVFHCHLNFHVLPNPILGPGMLSEAALYKKLFSAPDMAGMHDMGNHAETGMGGLVMAIKIKPAADWKPYVGPRENLRLLIQTDSQPSDTARRFGYALANTTEAPTGHEIRWPGPALILHKGKPTSIWVVNHAAEPTQVHWHGLELDSYYDGVAGLSSNAGMVSPMIMPSDSFQVTITPPRAGSFMYHTHINDLRQQSHGLYGPIIVLGDGETWDPSTDLVFQLATDPADNPILNGSKTPDPITLKAGTKYRMRLMNVTLDNPAAEMWLVSSDGRFPLWTAMAKDGFDRPAWQRTESRARQRISIGETYDFSALMTPGDYELQARGESGLILTKQVIHVVK
ncbi:MAG TPA: multicopper oxidase domain-containing protein [Gemmatimonadaceae bacterium]